MKYIFGAYGTNNVGDEAIFEGASKVYPDLIEIYVNKSTRPNSIWYADLLQGRKTFNKEADELIMGGGGLFHSKHAVNDYIKMAELAILNGLKFTIQGVGMEHIDSSFEEESTILFNMASNIVVRSEESKKIANSLGFEVDVNKDFAYNLSDTDYKPTEFNLKPNRPTIGYVTQSMSDGDLLKNAKIIKLLLDKVNIVHIPHSKAFVNQNNDVVNGNRLWSSIEIYHSDRENRFITLPYNNNPREVLNIYKQLNGLIGYRYHSYIFSELVNIPLFGITMHKKFETYFDDTTRKDCKHINFNDTLENIIKELDIFITKDLK